MSNIVDVVVADKNLATMSKSVKATGLETELAKQGPFTVFAPSEMAFGKLASGVLTGWMKPENKIKFAEVLNHHVIEGKTNFKDLKDGQKLVTVNRRELRELAECPALAPAQCSDCALALTDNRRETKHGNRNGKQK